MSSSNIGNLSRFTSSRVGQFNVLDNQNHAAGISYGVLVDSYSFPKIVIDSRIFDLIPCNRDSASNNKIVDMMVDYSSGWKLKVKVVIDGRVYDKYATLS